MRMIYSVVTKISIGIAAVVISYTSAAADPSWMPTTGRTSQPVGHYEFCQQYPTECQPNELTAIPELTDEL